MRDFRKHFCKQLVFFKTISITSSQFFFFIFEEKTPQIYEKCKAKNDKIVCTSVKHQMRHFQSNTWIYDNYNQFSINNCLLRRTTLRNPSTKKWGRSWIQMTTRLHNKSDNEKKGKSNIHFVRELIRRRRIRQEQKYEISKWDLAQSWANSLLFHLAWPKNPLPVLGQTFFMSEGQQMKSYFML